MRKSILLLTCLFSVIIAHGQIFDEDGLKTRKKQRFSSKSWESAATENVKTPVTPKNSRSFFATKFQVGLNIDMLTGDAGEGFDPGSGYEFNSKVIAKPLIARDLAIFLSRNFPTFSPHLQVFVQSEPRISPPEKHESG